MKGAYFWPVYGEHDEGGFPFFESRRAEHVEQALGLKPAEGAVLLSDGYSAYAHYAAKTGITHAQCWAHTRRHLFDAQGAQPQAAARPRSDRGPYTRSRLHIRDNNLTAARKLDYRLIHAKPIVEQFFAWVNQTFEAHGLLPSNPLTKALAYAESDDSGSRSISPTRCPDRHQSSGAGAARHYRWDARRGSFLDGTGAKYVGIVQSLIVTCPAATDRSDGLPWSTSCNASASTRLAGASAHPRLWKQHFAANPLRSALHNLARRKQRTP